VVETVYVNIRRRNLNVKIVTVHSFVNIKYEKINVKGAEVHKYVVMGDKNPVVRNAKVLEYVNMVIKSNHVGYVILVFILTIGVHIVNIQML